MRLTIPVCACLAALAFAGTAAAAPRLALFDLRTDLAPASRNDFGDVRIDTSRSALAGRAPRAALVRCAGICTYGKGWLAFSRPPALTSADLASARAHRVRGSIWGLRLELTPAGVARWSAFSRRAARAAANRGIADALVLVVDGSVAGQPLADHIVRKRTTLELVGLSRANAQRAAKALQ